MTGGVLEDGVTRVEVPQVVGRVSLKERGEGEEERQLYAVLADGEKIAEDLLPMLVRIDTLIEHPANPNEGDVDGIAESLEEFGQYAPIVVQASTRFIVKGNHTKKGAAKNGWRYIAANVMPMSDKQALGILAGDNRHSEKSRRNPEALARVLQELTDGESGLKGTGYTPTDLDDLLASLDTTADDAPLPPGAGLGAPVPSGVRKAVTRTGDIWQLGRHRLMCGNSRSEGDVERLFDEYAGEAASVVVTSPPYADRRKYDGTSEFRPIPPEEYGEWFRDVSRRVSEVLDERGSFFLNIKPHSEDGQRSLYVADLLLMLVREHGWRFVDELVWRNTRNGVPGTWPDRFKNAWEPVYHFAKAKGFVFHPEGRAKASDMAFDYHPDNNDAQSGSGIGIGQYKAGGFKQGLALPSNVIEAASESAQGEHTAPFPVDLPDFLIACYSDPGAIVYDPFAGTGTVMVAAERCKSQDGKLQPRRALLMEIGPRYCDLIVRRFCKLTGQDAIRHDGARWSELAPSDDELDDVPLDDEGSEDE